jgi:succinate dehydrogenase / fumarate reductase, iron-sulfur subunit
MSETSNSLADLVEQDAPEAAPRTTGAEMTLRVFRGDANGGAMVDYAVPVAPGMVVLDALHYIQGHLAPDLAVRWNCKAGKCGSCSAEVNGRPRLTCKTRMDDLPKDEPVIVMPMKSFPRIKDLVTDVSWNYAVNKKITPFTPKPGVDWKISQLDVDRVQEFRKCIECFLCQDVCHVLRDHDKKEVFGGPRFFVRTAGLEMHPLDGANRLGILKNELGLGYCNITKCCSEVCPEEIHITDNAIIPLKERVVDEFYDPLTMLFRKVFGSAGKSA